ncbi:MAG TPA: SOS response-associated peptidase [Roseiflexaceae bacterium]|nr:SOS response-associated peptidase [Roseiflexaceae bacterium]
MCGRYTLSQPEKVPERFETANEMPPYDGSYNIKPTTTNPIILQRSPNTVHLARWNLVPFWAKDARKLPLMINARAEGIRDKPAFRKPIRSQRCLVPADGFYEWKEARLGGKKSERFPWYISLKDRPLFAFAGLYEVWRDPEGNEHLTYAIITTRPNKTLEAIHDRMPVILPENDEDLWLDTSTPLETVLDLLKPFPDGELVSHPVSQAVNGPYNDGPGLIEPVQPPSGV